MPVVEPSLMKWGRWFQGHRDERIVKQEKVNGYKVSTVFLGLDHNWSLKGPPVLWETMVFGKGRPLDTETDRCAGSKEQAEAMHARMVRRVKANQYEIPTDEPGWKPNRIGL